MGLGYVVKAQTRACTAALLTTYTLSTYITLSTDTALDSGANPIINTAFTATYNAEVVVSFCFKEIFFFANRTGLLVVFLKFYNPGVIIRARRIGPGQ
jgi:hypothetical protein